LFHLYLQYILYYFSDTYRAALSALPLTPKEEDAVVGEAIVGFDYAKRMFEDLDKAYPTA
jgi:heme oxygenase